MAQYRNPETGEIYDSETKQIIRPTSNLANLNRAAAQGLTFGFGDEIEAMMRAPFSDQTYRELVTGIRGDIERFRQESPVQAYGAEFGGGLLTGGLGGARAAAALTARQVPRLRQLMGIGAAEGALTGAGTAETISEIPERAAMGTVLGAGLGAGGRAVERGILRTPRTQAGRQIQQALDRDQMTVKQAQEALTDLGPQGMLADVSPSLQGKARAVALQPGGGKNIAETALKDRQMGQVGRIKAETGYTDDFQDYLGDIAAQRSAQARPLYETAHQATVEPTPQMIQLQNSEPGQAAWRTAVDRYTTRYGLARDEVGDVSNQAEVWDQFGRRLRGMSEAAYRSGDNDMGSALRQQYDNLNTDLYRQVPELREARAVFSDFSGLKEAAEQGRKLFTGAGAKTDIRAAEVAALSTADKEAFRRGAMRALFDRLEMSVQDANAARNLIKTDKVRNLLRNTFDTDDEYNRFISMLERESQMGETFSGIMRGSRTAPLTAEMRDVNIPLGTMADMAQGNYAQAGQGLLAQAMDRFSRLSDPASEELAKALFAQGPAAQSALAGVNRMAVPGQMVPGLLAPAVQQTQFYLGGQ